MLYLILAAWSGFIPVYEYDGEAFLAYDMLPDGSAIVALSLDGESVVTGFAPFPGLFNPAKTDALFKPAQSTIEVASQAPYTAVYSMSTYLLSEGTLTLLESGVEDPYTDDYRDAVKLLAKGRLEEASSLVEGIMYPQAMPNGRELCLHFLEAAFRCARAGRGIECFEAANQASLVLLGRQAHELIGPGEEIPPGCISGEEYNAALEAYASALEEAGNTVMASRVREGLIR
jgi:hypothetical protein